MTKNYDYYVRSCGLSLVNTTISAGEEFSPEVKSMGKKLMAISMPDTWTSGSISFQGKTDNTNGMLDLYDDTTEVAFNVSASRTILLPAEVSEMFAGLSSFRFRSGVTGGSVSQEADRVIGFSLLSP